MKIALATGAALLLAIAALRRVRGVLRPGPRTSVARSAEADPPGLAAGMVGAAAMAAAGVVVVIAIVWAGLELLT